MGAVCKTETAAGLGGVGNTLEQTLSGAVQQLISGALQKLMSGGQGGGGGGGSDSGGGFTGSNCTQTQTSDFNTYASNPSCYYYVAPVSNALGGTNTGTQSGTSVSDQLLSALGGNTGSTGSTDSSNTNTNTNTNVSTILSTTGSTESDTSATVKATTTATITSNSVIVPTGAVNLLPGFRGDIQLMNNGATILAGQRDTTSNTEVAGFFGSNSFGGQSTGIVASLCQSRPWASGLFSKVIPASFFDSLCSLRGYQVGAPQATVTTQVKATQTAPKPITTSPAATSTPTVPPKVDIWAVPAKVSLGSRTSIFWNTQGVTECSETSPDGSFSQSTLSGGASTVPITAATTFTISCLAPDGSHVTDYVIVDIAI